jgi:hypothetical protein
MSNEQSTYHLPHHIYSTHQLYAASRMGMVAMQFVALLKLQAEMTLDISPHSLTSYFNIMPGIMIVKFSIVKKLERSTINEMTAMTVPFLKSGLRSTYVPDPPTTYV